MKEFTKKNEYNMYTPSPSLFRGNNFIKLMTIVCDVCVSNVLFLFLRTLFERAGHDCMIHLGDTKMIVILSLCYLIASMKVGMVLYKRKVLLYEVLVQVLKTVSLFGLIFGMVVAFGAIMKVRTLFFMVFLTAFLVAASLVRITLRLLVIYFRRRGRNLQHVVLVGSSRSIRELYHELTDDGGNGYHVAGYFDDLPNDKLSASTLYLGTPEEVNEYLSQHPEVTNLFCGLHSSDSERIIHILDYCENHLVHFYSVPNLHNYLHNRMYLSSVGDVPVLSLHNTALERADNAFLKRLFDIVFSLLFLCTLFPVIFFVVAIITKLTMPGPIFFLQKRNGLNDKEFYCIKFRSMKVNKEADTLQATKNDPRKTRWGEIMRKTNIDELPQFINVLMGDMSVVGPRPHMLKHTEEYSKLIDKYMVRHFVKPGITGWSQVTGFRGETKELKDMEGRIRGDIWYIEHWSFLLDLYIIFKTLTNALGGDQQAY